MLKYINPEMEMIIIDCNVITDSVIDDDGLLDIGGSGLGNGESGSTGESAN